MMKRATKGRIIKGTALGIDVLVPLVATLVQFPVWVDRSSEATVSGLFAVCAIMSFIPLMKQIKKVFCSPASWILWLIVLVCLVSMRSIIDEMITVALFGCIGNLIGAAIWKIGCAVAPDVPTVRVVKDD